MHNLHADFQFSLFLSVHVHTMNPVLAVFFLLHLVHTGFPTTIIVNTSNHLERLLCDDELNNNEVNLLILNTSITHRISSGKFCTVNIRHSLTITSSSSDTLAHIICVSNNKTQYDKYWTRGFAFHGTRGLLTLSGLNFSKCGTNLTTLHKNLINHTNSFIHFTQYHAAVLVSTDIANITIHNVSIVDYNGFAIVAVNLPNASFNFLLVANGQSIELEAQAFHNISIGSGMLVLFYNQSQVAQKDYLEYKLSIKNSTFNANYAFGQYWNRSGATCVTGVYDKFYSNFPIINAAGITILYAQQDIPANVSILQTKFYRCTGYYAGAVLLIRFDSILDSQTVIDRSNFSHNSLLPKCRGAAIASYSIFGNFSRGISYQPLTVTNTIIAQNGETYFVVKNVWSSGAIFIYVVCHQPKLRINFIFRKVSFCYNMAQYHGASMYVNIIPNSESTKVHFLMESIEAHYNPVLSLYRMCINAYLDLPASIFFFINIDQIVINGSVKHPGNFSQNYGSVFEIVKSTVVLQGYLSFRNNTADHGPALRLLENSLVYLKEELNAIFANNKAKSLGGAIYAAGKLFTTDPCTFQLYSKNYKNIAMSFINNFAALAGNAIYSQKIYNANCYINNTTPRIYGKIFKNITSTDISSFGDTIIVCNKKYAYEVYPGASLQIPIRIIDSNHNPTYGVLTVSAAVRTKDGLENIDWFFSDNRDTYSSIIKGTNSCTYINFTLHATALGKHNRRGTILFSTSNPNKVFGVRVTLKKCPPGFRLHPVKGACVCLNHFAALVYQHSNRKELVCDIDNNAFNRPYPYLWVGASNNSLCYSLNCHPGYCNVYSHLDMLRFNDTGSYVSSLHKDLQPLCHGSRTGDVCGECIPNYSVVFGSTDCKICSDKRWLLTGIIYIVAGPLLIFILYKLNLTLTKGTLNGIIFYAQIANAGVQRYLNTPCSDCSNESYFIKFTSLFISWLNLNLGFPLCFYDGMTELQKSGLTLLFPIYLLFIIGLLVILSRFSTAVSNHLSKSSVQVLVTIVHLSFTQLLQAVLAVFGSAEVFIENENSFTKEVVWYCNGATVYASTKHRWLMIITSVVVGLILIPYMAIILFGKQLMKFDKLREYIRPFFEAIYAPYKDNMWYWFALNQVYVVLAYVFTTMGALNYSISSVFFIPLYFIFNQVFFTSQACFSPFKNKILNGLNFFLVVNLITVYYTATSYYHQYPKAVVTFVSISVCPSILIFSLIVTFHILQVTNKLNTLFQLFETFKRLCRWQAQRLTNRENCATFNYRDIQDSGDCTQAREPLLEYIST